MVKLEPVLRSQDNSLIRLTTDYCIVEAANREVQKTMMFCGVTLHLSMKQSGNPAASRILSLRMWPKGSDRHFPDLLKEQISLIGREELDNYMKRWLGCVKSE